MWSIRAAERVLWKMAAGAIKSGTPFKLEHSWRTWPLTVSVALACNHAVQALHQSRLGQFRQSLQPAASGVEIGGHLMDHLR
jgi:hypothetical protein